MRGHSIRRTLVSAGFFSFLALSFAGTAGATYVQQNLVSNGSVPGTLTDPNLINAWGMSYSPTGPFWVSSNGADVATLYNGAGVIQSLVVSTPAAPTGQVFNGGSGFTITNGTISAPARFLFASESGTISGWNSTVNPTHAVIPTGGDQSGAGAVYKGLAIATDAGAQRLYAANFAKNTVDVFDGSFNLVKQFTDPSLPANYAPFNVQTVNGQLIVTFAQREVGGTDDVKGAGKGFVDIFATDGTLLKQLVTQGPLNAPWGVALAPSGFGEFGKDLLIGNFGDGRINAFDPLTGAFLGALLDHGKNPLTIDGLWGLSFGNGGAAGQTNQLFFTAGPDGEANGLFGRIVVPEPASLLLLLTGLGALMLVRRKAG
ncbi:MAG: motif protein [Rhodospirillales bacterium]|nr:motif protein [Rhodospirillales bacterium]